MSPSLVLILTWGGQARVAQNSRCQPRSFSHFDVVVGGDKRCWLNYSMHWSVRSNWWCQSCVLLHLSFDDFHVLANEICNLESLSKGFFRIRIFSRKFKVLTCDVVRMTLDCFFSDPVMIIRQFMFGENERIE
jgi:hypothetical protein